MCGSPQYPVLKQGQSLDTYHTYMLFLLGYPE